MKEEKMKIYQIVEDYNNEKHAGSKATNDAVAILSELGAKGVPVLVATRDQGILGKVKRQIKFYKEKINAMEYRLDNVNKTEREELNEFYLGSNMKNVSIVNKLNSTVNYYAGENRTISEAEGVREILGEKYIQKENKSQ